MSELSCTKKADSRKMKHKKIPIMGALFFAMSVTLTVIYSISMKVILIASHSVGRLEIPHILM